MNNKTFDDLVAQFQADHSTFQLDNVMVEFSRFIKEEGVEPYNLQWYCDDFQRIVAGVVTIKVNNTNVMAEDEIQFITDYLSRQIEIRGKEYIIVPVEEINENTVKGVIAEAINNISSDEIKEGNIPKHYLMYLQEQNDNLADFFYIAIDDMKEEAEFEKTEEQIQELVEKDCWRRYAINRFVRSSFGTFSDYIYSKEHFDEMLYDCIQQHLIVKDEHFNKEYWYGKLTDIINGFWSNIKNDYLADLENPE